MKHFCNGILDVWKDAQLLPQPQTVKHIPDFDNFAIGDAKDVDPYIANWAMGGGETGKLALVCVP